MSAEALVDPAKLLAFLTQTFPDANPSDYTVERHRAGHSNETFFVRFDGRDLVLRRPPGGAFLPTAHDVLREHRVLTGLVDAGARTPHPIAACDDEAVLGAPFYLMERVHGHVVRAALPAELDAAGPRARIGDELIDALVELHAVAWQDGPLATLGKPTGYLERQVKRWSTQLELTRPHTEEARDVPDLRAVGGWLAAHVPPERDTTIVHGDYKLDNVVLDDDGRVAAILDWEMATLGDPLADLGWCLSFWRDAGDPTVDMLGIEPRVTEQDGFRTRAELVARYEEASGREYRAPHFYEALAIWKLAILLEGSFARHLAGATDDPLFAAMRDGVPALARRALARIKRGAA